MLIKASKNYLGLASVTFLPSLFAHGQSLQWMKGIGADIDTNSALGDRCNRLQPKRKKRISLQLLYVDTFFI